MDLVIDSGVDALKDCVKLIPFLLVTYLLMEWLERKTEEKQIRAMKSAGMYGPFIGGLLGVVPQCGFSLVAANLYSGGVITVGVLLAVFLSTSDEMLPIFMSQSVPSMVIIKILLTKAVIAIVTGYVIDIANRWIKKRMNKDSGKKKVSESFGKVDGHNRSDSKADGHNHHDDIYLAAYEETDIVDDGSLQHHGHDHAHHIDGEKSIHGVCVNEHCNCQDGIIKSTIKHTIKIALFIVVISFAINVIIGLIGEENIQRVFSDVPVIGELVSALVGLIPNCAASVIITQLYLEGVLNAGAMMAGLLVSAGVGIMVLFRMNRKRIKENMKIILTLFAVSVIWGLLINIAGIKF